MEGNSALHMHAFPWRQVEGHHDCVQAHLQLLHGTNVQLNVQLKEAHEFEHVLLMHMA